MSISIYLSVLVAWRNNVVDSKKLAILGCGGHARSVADIALSLGFSTLCFIDDNAKPGESILGYPVFPSWDVISPDEWIFFSAVGDNHKRKLQLEILGKMGWQVATLISATATIGINSIIGKGTFVGHHGHIGPSVKIGEGCIINSGAIIEHDVCVDEFTHVSVNSTVAGSVNIGKLCFIGAGATIINNITVRDEITVGAGACVVNTIDQPGIYVGVPAKKYK